MSNVINVTEIAAQLAASQNTTKVAAKATVDAVIQIIADSLVAGNEVSLHGLGKFKLPVRAARSGTNALTGKPYSTPAQHTVKFKATTSLIEAVKQIPVSE